VPLNENNGWQSEKLFCLYCSKPEPMSAIMKLLPLLQKFLLHKFNRLYTSRIPIKRSDLIGWTTSSLSDLIFFECSARLLSSQRITPSYCFIWSSLKISAYVLQSLTDLIAVVAVTVNVKLSPVEVKIILACSSKRIQPEAITLL
jgi:hypothetical protein